jgi:RNA polymerase sigma-70 factor, ECF subfamily
LTGARTMPAGRRMGETEQLRMAAFRQLADQRLDASYRLATAILGDSSQSQDAVHDAVLLAWERWPSLREQAKFAAWFDRIVVNVCRNRLRHANARRAADIATQPPLSTPDHTTEVHRRLQLAQAFERLKPDDVVVLALRHFLDLQLEDIASLMDVPVPTVNSRLRSARSRLRDILDEQSTDKVSP